MLTGLAIQQQQQFRKKLPCYKYYGCPFWCVPVSSVFLTDLHYLKTLRFIFYCEYGNELLAISMKGKNKNNGIVVRPGQSIAMVNGKKKRWYLYGSNTHGSAARPLNTFPFARRNTANGHQELEDQRTSIYATWMPSSCYSIGIVQKMQ